VEREKLAPDALLGLEEAAAWAGCSVEILSRAVSSGALLHETRRVRGREVPHVRFVDLEGLIEAPVGAPVDALVEAAGGEEPEAGPPEHASPEAAPAEPASSPQAEAGAESEREAGAARQAPKEPACESSQEAGPSAPARDPRTLHPRSARLEVRVEELLARLEASEQERRAQAAALLLTNRRLLELAGPVQANGLGRGRGLALGAALLSVVTAFAWASVRAEDRWERRLAGAEALGQERLAVVSTELAEQRALLEEEAQARAAAAEAASLTETRLREDLAAVAAQGMEQAQAAREEAALQLSDLLERQERERQAWARQAESREAARERTLEQLLARQRVELQRQDERAQAELADLQTALEEKLAAAIERSQRERASLEGAIGGLMEREAQQGEEVERLRAALRESEDRLGDLASEGTSLRQRLEAAERESLLLKEQRLAQEGLRPEAGKAPPRLPWGLWLAERLARSLSGPKPDPPR
jgi:hypothetical protein